MSTTFEQKKRIEHKMTAPVSISAASEFDTQLISQTLAIYKAKTGYNLYFVTTYAKPLPKEFGRSSQIDLSQQYLLKYREALFALRHNLKFVITAAKINQTMPVKSAENGKNEKVLVDLNYLRDQFKFNHSPLTLAQNKQKSENIQIQTNEFFTRKIINSLKTSKSIVETLEGTVNKSLLTPEDIRAKEQVFASADTIINSLESEKISLKDFQNEISKEDTNKLETR